MLILEALTEEKGRALVKKTKPRCRLTRTCRSQADHPESQAARVLAISSILHSAGTDMVRSLWYYYLTLMHTKNNDVVTFKLHTAWHWTWPVAVLLVMSHSLLLKWDNNNVSTNWLQSAWLGYARVQNHKKDMMDGEIPIPLFAFLNRSTDCDKPLMSFCVYYPWILKTIRTQPLGYYQTSRPTQLSSRNKEIRNYRQNLESNTL